MKIWINNRQRTTVLSQEKLRKKAAKILSALELPDRELSLTLINDRAMAHLNRETFGRRGPTNVIAFPLDDAPSPNGPPALLGEVVISLQTTRRQAQEFGWPWRELLDFFLIHGILHLLGYDHEEPAAAASMDVRAWELMSLLYPGRSWADELTGEKS
ncbi:MAG TPA: rRNA maturation RNase YbeY [Desulfobaccales bacterium]|nr:rRNA maturation RNase YbeY [Desulfobaccales bacterium]